MSSGSRVRFFDFPVDLRSLHSALEQVAAFFANPTAGTSPAGVSQPSTFQVVTLNPEMLMQGEQDTELGHILKTSDLVIPDGAGLVWSLRLYGQTVNRLPGIEFSEALLAWAAKNKKPVAIIGAKQDTLEAAIANLTSKYSGLSIVYARNGFFNTDADMQSAVDACVAANPAIVLVAMGVPRQEKWIAQYRHRFQKTVFVGVGGSLDVWSGQSKRAPALMRAIHLEWLYRITSEPWRIQRVAKTLPMFVVKVCLSFFGTSPLTAHAAQEPS